MVLLIYLKNLDNQSRGIYKLSDEPFATLIQQVYLEKSRALVSSQLSHMDQLLAENQPEAEGIVDYLTYKLTGPHSCITEYTLGNWEKLKKMWE